MRFWKILSLGACWTNQTIRGRAYPVRNCGAQFPTPVNLCLM